MAQIPKANGVFQVKLGDTVRLKSGGPTMTIAGTGTLWKCIWWSVTHLCYKFEDFPSDALMVVEVKE